MVLYSSEQKDAEEASRMNLDTFVTKALLSLAKVDLGAPQNVAAVFTELYRPLIERQHFKIGHSEVLTLARADTMTPEVLLHPTLKHRAYYLTTIVKRLQAYSELVCRNQVVCTAYQTPTFDAEQAAEFAREALEESFYRYTEVKKSYLPLQKILQERGGVSLELRLASDSAGESSD